MRRLRIVATGASAFFVLFFVIAPANSKSIKTCQKIFGGSLDVNEIRANSVGLDVHMRGNLVMPSFSTQELLGAGRSESEIAWQTTTFIIQKFIDDPAGSGNFLPPVNRNSFEGKTTLNWRKYVTGSEDSILRNLRVTYRLLNDGGEVDGFVHEEDGNQVLDVDLYPIAPRFLCKIQTGGPYIIEGGAVFEIELRKLVRSGEHNVSVEVSVDSP